MTAPDIITHKTNGPCPSGTCLAANLTVVMVDPSSFTLPYDSSLCQGLASCGCNVTLARSQFLHSEWAWPGNGFEDCKHFYPLTHAYARRYGRGRLWKVAKAVEHALDMESFVAKMRHRRPDVIHFQWLPVPLIDKFLVRPLARVAKLVLTLHNTKSLFHGSVSKLQAATAHSMFDAFHAVIVHTEYGRRRVIEQGWIGEDRVHVIPHGIFEYYRRLSSGNEQTKAQEQTILFFGSIEAYKGLHLLIEAFARLPQTILARTRLMVAGKPGIDMKPLRDRASLLGIDHRITWDLRFFREEEVPVLFAGASLVVLPYTDIDQSGVLMTALAFDKPVVASRVGGIAETIRDGVEGLLVPPGDIPSLTTALAAVLSDGDLRMSMGRAVCQLRGEDLSWQSISRRTLNLYERLITTSRGSRNLQLAA